MEKFIMSGTMFNSNEIEWAIEDIKMEYDLSDTVSITKEQILNCLHCLDEDKDDLINYLISIGKLRTVRMGKNIEYRPI